MEITNQIIGFYLLRSQLFLLAWPPDFPTFSAQIFQTTPSSLEIGGACAWAGFLHLSFQIMEQMDLNGIQVSNTAKIKPASFGNPCRVIFHNEVNQPPNLWFKKATL